MPHLIKVTNNNDFEIHEMCDGIPYVFAKGKPVNVPLDAMKHIFGVDFPEDKETLDSPEFRKEVFESVSKRFGWNVGQKFDPALNRFLMVGNAALENRSKMDNIEFIPVIYRMVEVKAEEELPAAREAKDHKKSREAASA